MNYEFSKFSASSYRQIFDDIVDGKLSDEKIKEFLLSLNQFGFSSQAFSGAIQSFKSRCTKIIAPKNAIDVCGTGGDKLNTLNISTAVAFVVAGCGIAVAKHGNRAASSKSGSADVLAELGVNIMAEKSEIENSLKQNNLCFMFAPLYHSAFKNIAKIRSELAVPTIFNFLGPLLNPADAELQLIGTSKQETILPMLMALQEAGSKRVFMVHGLDGMDEATICDNFLLVKLEDGKRSEPEVINPEDFGIRKVAIEQIKGGDAKYNAAKIIALLDGEKSAYLDIVMLNAALALMVAKPEIKNIAEGIEEARAAVASGKAKEVLQKLQQI
jgi:anthranilate phosphoribosyltransferase